MIEHEIRLAIGGQQYKFSLGTPVNQFRAFDASGRDLEDPGILAELFAAGRAISLVDSLYEGPNQGLLDTRDKTFALVSEIENVQLWSRTADHVASLSGTLLGFFASGGTSTLGVSSDLVLWGIENSSLSAEKKKAAIMGNLLYDAAGTLDDNAVAAYGTIRQIERNPGMVFDIVDVRDMATQAYRAVQAGNAFSQFVDQSGVLEGNLLSDLGNLAKNIGLSILSSLPVIDRVGAWAKGLVDGLNLANWAVEQAEVAAEAADLVATYKSQVKAITIEEIDSQSLSAMGEYRAVLSELHQGTEWKLTGEADYVFLGGGDDTVLALGGSDLVVGGTGSDTAQFEYNWELYRPLSTTSPTDFRLELTQFDRSTDRLISIEKLQFENRFFNTVADYFEAYTNRFLTVAPVEEDLPDPDPVDNPDTPSTSPGGLPLMYVRGASIAEGDSGSRTMRFEVELGQASSTPVSFIYSATGGNSLGIATTGTDFEFAVDTVTFSPGQTLKSIPITVIGDRVEEPDEYLNFLVSNVTGAELARGGAFVIEKGYIRDDDGPTVAEPDPEPEPPEVPNGPVYLTIESRDESQFEGSDGTAVKYDFTVLRTGDLSQRTDFRIDVSGYGSNSANSTDFDGGRFPTISGSFSPGDDREGVDIFVTSDSTQEADEYFQARLRSSDATAIVTNDRAYAAILNDDGNTLPSQGGEVYLSIRALQSEIFEGTSDTQRPVMQFEITRTGDLAQFTEFRLRDARLDYPTVASRDTFFTGTSPWFEIGETSYIADIRLRADDVNEPNELFTLRLSRDSDYPNAVILNEYASTLILNDDGPDPAQITSDAVAVMETDGSQIVQVPVHLSKVMTVDVSMAYEVRDRTNATPGEDFVARTGVLTIPAGSLSANLAIEVLGDTTPEGLEGVQVQLEDPVNGYFGNSNLSSWDTGVVIVDDDTFPQASVPFDVVAERSVRIGELEKYSAIDLFFDLPTETDLFAVEVEVVEPIPIRSDGTSPDLIFDAVGNLLHANMSSFNYLDAGSVSGIGDNYVFPVGTYHFVYAAPETPIGSYGVELIGSPAEGEIPLLLPELDNLITLNPNSLPFGATGGLVEGSTGIVVQTKVSHEVDYDISYDIEFRPVSATVEDLGGQTLIASEVLGANDFSEATFVWADNDTLPEPTELFEFVITNVVGAVLPNRQSEYALPAVIFDNDASPLAEFDIEDIGGSRAEGTGASTDFEFKVSRPEGQSGNLATVSWHVSGSGLNAASRFDFVGDQLPSGELTFDIGETEKIISVSVAGEAFSENDESFSVRLSNPSDGFGLRTSTANAVIRNDDGVPDSPLYGDGVVVSSTSYQMGDDDDDLILIGAAPVYGVGNTKPNAISGNNAQNILEGREGNDELWGFGGNDSLLGHAGADQLIGGAGNDTLNGSNGRDILDGGSGADRLNGGNDGATADVDVLIGGSGNDRLYSGQSTKPADGYQERGDRLFGGTGHDRLVGGSADDWLEGGSRNDTILGGLGDDHIETGTFEEGAYGRDEAYGGEGNDHLNGSNGSDTLFGEAGNDTLNGGDDGTTADVDVLRGGSGKDSLVSGQVDTPRDGFEHRGDQLFGEGGNDTLVGGLANDYLEGGSGNDTLSGGGGDDLIHTGEVGSSGYGRNWADGELGDDEIIGSNGRDTLYGGEGDDTLNGGNDGATADVDVLIGGSGNDRLYSGQSTKPADGYQERGDRLFGGTGHDRLVGGSADDWLEGGSRNDTILGGLGDDHIETGTFEEGAYGRDEAYGGEGNDHLNGSNGSDTLFGEAGNDTLNGGDDGTTADVDVLRGGSGKDSLVSGQVDTPRDGFEHRGDQLFGEGGNDTLVGGLANDYLEGGSGNDTLSGGGGDDLIHTGEVGSSGYGRNWADGELGDDEIIGSNGRDTLYGGEGDDTLNGGNDGATADVDVLIGGSGNDRLVSGQVEQPNESFQARGDQLFGEGGNDTLIGGRADDRLEGGAGNDSILGGGGDDVIVTGVTGQSATGTNTAHGQGGNDSITGSNGRDALYGNSGNDTLNGGDDWVTADKDDLFGGSGDDLLISGQVDAPRNGFESRGDRLHGEEGNDILVGGLAADEFHFQKGWDSDRIDGFQDDLDEVFIAGFNFETLDEVMAFARQDAASVVFAFGEGDTLTISGTSIAALENDIVFS